MKTAILLPDSQTQRQIAEWWPFCKFRPKLVAMATSLLTISEKEFQINRLHQKAFIC